MQGNEEKRGDPAVLSPAGGALGTCTHGSFWGPPFVLLPYLLPRGLSLRANLTDWPGLLVLL